MLSFFYSLHRTSYTKRAWQDIAFHTSWKKNETEENLTGWQKKKTWPILWPSVWQNTTRYARAHKRIMPVMLDSVVLYSKAITVIVPKLPPEKIVIMKGGEEYWLEW